MGEGKTRVILAMLLLQLADSKRLVRLDFLSSLLNASYDFLHHTITASILCRRLYLLPFRRDLKPSPREACIMLQCLKGCQKSQGSICLSLEHRLSLHLKWHELGLSGDETSKKVRSRLESISKLPSGPEKEHILCKAKCRCEVSDGPLRCKGYVAFLGQSYGQRRVKCKKKSPSNHQQMLLVN